MAFFDNIRNAIHPYDDEYMENEESAAEEEFEQERAPEEESYEPPRPAFSRRENRAAPTPPPPAPEKQKTKLQLAKPSSYDEAAGIADSLKQRQAILMNLENTDTGDARRLLDFLSGVADALDGKIMRVSAQAYIIAPTNVDLVGDALADFESAGIYF